jgi:hypothetical protein
MSRRVLVAALAGSAILTAAALISRAGPLSPPSGAVAPTYKTLAEVEPRIAVNAANTPPDASALFSISQPGSYYLTGNITVAAASTSAIDITCDNVSLDLCGFTIAGLTGSGQTPAISGTHSNVRVRSGVIHTFGYGLSLAGGTQYDASDLVISDCLVGIYMGDSAVARDCSVSASNGGGGYGILVGSSSTVLRCCVTSGYYGIETGNGSFIDTCRVSGSAGAGIITEPGVSALHCVASRCMGSGFGIVSLSHLDSCEAGSNGQHGFCFVGAPGGNAGIALNHCTAVQNTLNGFNIPNAMAQYVDCAALQNTGIGFSLGADATLDHCSAIGNSSGGVSAGARLVATACTAGSNAASGFSATDTCTIQNCTADANGSSGTGYGITISGAGGRLDSNTCSGNVSGGIRLTGSFNMVLRNTCRATAGASPANNFILGVGNDFGPVITVTNTTSNTGVGDISGTTNSGHPWANFSY